FQSISDTEGFPFSKTLCANTFAIANNCPNLMFLYILSIPCLFIQRGMNHSIILFAQFLYHFFSFFNPLSFFLFHIPEHQVWFYNILSVSPDYLFPKL